MSKTTTAAEPQATTPTQWERVSVAELIAHPGNVREVQVPADVMADITANGVEEPLHIVRTRGGVPQVIDGFLRLAAAIAAGLESVPFTPRPVIRIDALTPHPKNAREDLDISAAFVESLRSEGCRIPVKVQRLDGGVIQVNDGNRRYFGSKEARLTHLPYEWEDDDRDEAGQILDMITTAQHRKALTRGEMTAAMFSAAEAGAQVGRIAKAAGVRQKDVKAVVKVKSNKTLNEAAASANYAWTFDELAALSEFADDPEALAAITKAAEDEDAADEVEWTIAIERTKREKKAKAQAHRAELEKAGQKVRDMAELSDRATPVWRLRTPDGGRITAEEHAECKGQVWVLEGGDDERLKPYCTSPALYGHAEPGNPMGGSGKSTAEKEAEKAARAAVKKGNIEWDAAETRRRQWLADLVKRRNLPKGITNALIGHINTALLGGRWGLCDDLNKEPTTKILAVLLGLTGDKAKYRVDFPEHVAKDPRRAPQLQFAAVAAVREKSASRPAWRTDDQRCNEIRIPTARWFAILEALGYQLTPIEQAVKDDEPYDPNKKRRAAITASAEPEQADQAPTAADAAAV
ncbi:ParB N-terminal domain-containing protein [Streptomyces sp. UNOC14_S4]|uniref:ParB N-terminal domain-containing protein n=1 Tax=Streptomyces sp. UNOC14_S4 TaxID=2872340 RepID=UPI001E584E4C|nr:ParB N-terminal domain-containing protein [Streptomyces sp. UNOC14_S4]MCC3767282.1 ParB N-terminal domain-containing protein [Streptomyces sp. UNOC14_S4]